MLLKTFMFCWPYILVFRIKESKNGFRQHNPPKRRWRFKRQHCTSSKKKFDVHRAVHPNVISIVKPTTCTNVSNLFYFVMTLYMFRTVFPSIIRSWRLYIQQQAFVKQILLPFQNKMNLIYWCILLVLL